MCNSLPNGYRYDLLKERLLHTVRIRIYWERRHPLSSWRYISNHNNHPKIGTHKRNTQFGRKEFPLKKKDLLDPFRVLILTIGYARRRALYMGS